MNNPQGNSNSIALVMLVLVVVAILLIALLTIAAILYGPPPSMGVTHLVDRHAFQIQRLRAKVLLVRPLHSTKGNAHLLEIMRIFEICKYAIIQVRDGIELPHAAIIAP